MIDGWVEPAEGAATLASHDVGPARLPRAGRNRGRAGAPPARATRRTHALPAPAQPELASEVRRAAARARPPCARERGAGPGGVVAVLRARRAAHAHAARRDRVL